MTMQVRTTERFSEPEFNLAIDHARRTTTIACAGQCDDRAWARLSEATDLVLHSSPQRLVLDLRGAVGESTPGLVLARVAELCRRKDLPLEIAVGEGSRAG